MNWKLGIVISLIFLCCGFNGNHKSIKSIQIYFDGKCDSISFNDDLFDEEREFLENDTKSNKTIEDYLNIWRKKYKLIERTIGMSPFRV
jgi:hypothetical protein